MKIIILVLFILSSCSFFSSKEEITENTPIKKDTVFSIKQEITLQEKATNLFKQNPEFIANSFDYSIGKSNAKGSYNAQGFGKIFI